MNLICVPIVVGVEQTRECINSLLAQDIETTVFAIDNGSKDGCSTLLRSYGSSISRIAYTQTRSLNAVWNDALTMAFGSLKLEHALVVNNDLVLRPDAYRLLLADGGDFVTGVGVGTMAEIAEINTGSRSPHPTFSCFLIRKKVWEEVGKFDEAYWAYASDCSYHLRMHRLGIPAYAIDVPFYHVNSGTMKRLEDADRDALQLKADADRAHFRMVYGFEVGSPEYEAAFKDVK